jgi:hypothetical protein
VRISLTKYFNECQSPGSLLRAVLENDLEEVACHLLASEIWNALPEIVRLLHVAAPTEAYGSPEKVALWLEPEAEPESTPEPTGFTFEERAEMLLDERIEAVAGALFTRLMRERDLCAMEARGL